MKKIIMLSVVVLFMLVGVAHAGNVVKFAGGPSGLSYEKTPKAVKPVVDAAGLGFTLEVITTQGGGENVQLVKTGKADFGIAPSKMVSQAGLPVVGVLFDTYAHLVCSKKLIKGATSIKDLVNLAESQKAPIQVAVGGPNSAARWIWDSLASLDDNYGTNNFDPVHVSFKSVIGMVNAGQVACAWTVSGVGSSAMKAADYPGADKVLQIMDVDDSDFNDDDYIFAEVDSANYPNIAKGWGSDIDTFKVPVVLFTRPGFKQSNPMGYMMISGEAKRQATILFKQK